ncbi:hypothetical protein RKE29_00985 [Streptomyces sp. B1866]|uniref:hypothetical protein n=1 Tax=Streptomyces sp. B1866 TaxID=3075431 RepID=UPI00288FA4F4|nr:hypothetical protein [Streptomyces sp. B1866]MDT3395237.1 hypothetical protein [Streptomyces sp. B1866]
MTPDKASEPERPTRRMCVHCKQTTDTPVLVHEGETVSGTTWNVYSCPDCAATRPLPVSEDGNARP